jgi:anti-sigma regulatory factor (Ser/Thr protein kinase)
VPGLGAVVHKSDDCVDNGPVSVPGAPQVAATRVRMVAQSESVPAVRRFVDDVLTTWGRSDLVDDVGLSVTELATNATLHSRSSYFDVELRAEPDAVHLAVVDAGAVPAQAIASRTTFESFADAEDLTLESMTGRGLFIVSALASSWGIEDLPGGTRFWADFASGGSYEPRDPVLRTCDDGGLPSIDEATAVIRLLDCPPDLLLAHDDNLADIARELRLFGASHEDPEAVAAAQRIAEVVRLSALSWDAARLVAKQAVHEGSPAVDIAIAVSDPEDLPRKVGVLRQAVGAAERMSAQGLLMTMAAPAPVQEWRDWVEEEMVEQATLPGREPVGFGDYRALLRSRRPAPTP